MKKNPNDTVNPKLQEFKDFHNKFDHPSFA